MIKRVKTTCPYCGVGCGVIAEMDETGQPGISGDAEHPANLGRLCSKGAALADSLGMQGRLLYPEVNGQTQSWDMALDLVADKFQDIIQQHGRDAVAFYVSGQLLTEDYYLANKLMKGFIGSANIDTNSRLCMSSAVAGHKRAFGADTVPTCYEDLERAKLIVLTGSNTAWCHPVLFQRIKQAKLDNPDLMVVVIDPRTTATTDIADSHLAITPGSDQILFSGLLVYLLEHAEVDDNFVQQHTSGLDEALQMARSFAGDSQQVADSCGLEKTQVESFYRLFARTDRVVTAYSQGINQWSYGTDRVNSIINCHLLSGRIGRPGMGPLSITGQPNAMGGREVGGLANQLAAHMSLDDPAHRDLVQRFWRSPLVAEKEGLKAVDMFKAMDEGRIKAIWIMATNPAVSMPDSELVRRALQGCDLVVVSDCVAETDTTKYAHVKFPAQTWGERDGTVTNSERRISRQRAFLPSPGEVRPDWWIISEVAKRMGFTAQFRYRDASEIFREHAQLSGFENTGQRDFDISALGQKDYRQYEEMTPIQWPVTHQEPQGRARIFADGQFFHPDSKARFIVVGESMPAHSCSTEFPLILNTGRVRDHWHTMTRTGNSARLSSHSYEPYCQIHVDDARDCAIEDGQLVEINSRQGFVVVRAMVGNEVQRGQVFIPIHWNDRFAANAVVSKLIAAIVDPFSGQPEYKHTPVSLRPYDAKWYGFMFSRRRLDNISASYWSVSRGKGLWRYELAGMEAPEDWAACARSMLCKHDDDIAWVEYFDKAQNRYRAARITNNRLESSVFIAPDRQLPPREWLMQLFEQEQLDESSRSSLLTGKAGSGEAPGRNICACFGVTEKQIVEVIEANNLTKVAQITEMLQAGGNCGSCIPEIDEILRMPRAVVD